VEGTVTDDGGSDKPLERAQTITEQDSTQKSFVQRVLSVDIALLKRVMELELMIKKRERVAKRAKPRKSIRLQSTRLRLERNQPHGHQQYNIRSRSETTNSDRMGASIAQVQSMIGIPPTQEVYIHSPTRFQAQINKQ
jgi:hypothetical protein